MDLKIWQIRFIFSFFFLFFPWHLVHNTHLHWGRLSYSKCHASVSPSDAHGNKFLKECGRKPVCRGAPCKTFQRLGGGARGECGTHQSTQGLYKERSVVAKRQMQNNLHEKPDHDPSSSSSSSSTFSQTFPLLPQLLQNIKAHLCHIKAERQRDRGGLGGLF